MRRSATPLVFLWLAAVTGGCSSAPLSLPAVSEAIQAVGPAEVLADSVLPASGPLLAPMAGPSILTGGWDLTEDAFVIKGYDILTGQPAGREALALAESGRELGIHAFSPDRSRLAVVTGTTQFCKPSGGGSACWPGSKALHFVDLATQEATLVDPGFGRVGAMAFSPDGRQLALVHEAKDSAEARLYDPTDGSLLRSASVPFVPDYFGYSADGKGLILLGADAGKDPGLAPPGPLTTLLIDATSLEVIWQQALDGIVHGSWCVEACDASHEFTLFANWWPAIVRIPGSDRVVIVHADADRLTSIDAVARRVTTMDVASPQSWLDRLMELGTTPAEAKGASEGAFREAVVSADGSRLYVVGSAYHARQTDDGMWDIWDEPLGLQVIDPSTGSLIREIESDASQVALTSDEAWLLLTVWGDVGMSTMILPVAELDGGRSLRDWYLIAGVSLDGKPLVLAQSASQGQGRTASIDPETLDMGPSWILPGAAALLLP